MRNSIYGIAATVPKSHYIYCIIFNIIGHFIKFGNNNTSVCF